MADSQQVIQVPTQEPTFVRVRNNYEPAPPTHGIIATISVFLFFPIGLAAAYCAVRSVILFKRYKDREQAEKYAKKAGILSWVAIGCFVVVLLGVSIAVSVRSNRYLKSAAV